MTGITWTQTVNKVHVRFLLKPGPAIYSSGWSTKALIVHRDPYEDATRFIPTFSQSSAYDGRPLFHAMLGRNILYSPDQGVSPGFYVEDLGQQWISFEYAADIAENSMRMWVSTADGRWNHSLVMEAVGANCRVWNTRRARFVTDGCVGAPWGTGSWRSIPILGGFHAPLPSGAPVPGAYVDLDDIVVSTEVIGPPSGFVGSAAAP